MDEITLDVSSDLLAAERLMLSEEAASSQTAEAFALTQLQSWNSELATIIFPEDQFRGSVEVNLRYISEINVDLLTPYKTIVVKSPIGTGKTRLAARLIEAVEQVEGHRLRILVITHRRTLAADLTRRLNIDLEPQKFECYQDISAEACRRADRLVICLNSLWKVVEVGNELPEYDLILVDEIEQVLAHLTGETFEGEEAINAYMLFSCFMATAGRTLVMDADAGPISQEWFTKWRELPFTVINTFVRERGPLLLYETRDKLIAVASDLIQRNEGPVVIATSSKTEAQRLNELYVPLLGKKQVFMICSDTSRRKQASDFITNINHELPKLKVFIYSPSVGTGVDIQCEVRAVFGAFDSSPLAAPELHQMLGRCRHTKETHVHLEKGGQHRETDAETLYRRYYRNAIETGKQGSLIDRKIWDITPPQKELLELFSRIDAERNHSMNHSRLHFTQMAKGYSIQVVEGLDVLQKQALEDTKKKVVEKTRLAILQAESVDETTYGSLSPEAQTSPEVKAGYERFQIERFVGMELNEQIYDDLHDVKDRERLRLLTNLYDDETYLELLDSEEASKQVSLQSRGHYQQRRRLLLDIFTTVFGPDWDAFTLKLTKEEISDRLQPYLRAEAKNFDSYFQRTNSPSQDPLRILGWYLKLVGLSLARSRPRINRKRTTVHYINEHDLWKMRAYSESRLARLRRDRTSGN